MKRFSMLAVFLFAGFLAMQGVALAEMIQGSVVSVDPNGESLQVTRTDQSGKASEVKVSVDEDTQYNGIQSAQELKAGDTVVLDADQNFFTRAWKVKSIERSEGVNQGAESQATSQDAATAESAATPDASTTDTDVDAKATADTTSPESASDRTAGSSGFDDANANTTGDAAIASGSAADTNMTDANAVPQADPISQAQAEPDGVADSASANAAAGTGSTAYSDDTASTGASTSAEVNANERGDTTVE
jgi:hypothetical protein